MFIMKFTKNMGMYLAAAFIAVAVYNVVAFVIPFKRGVGFWTGYGFTMAAFPVAAGVGLYALGRGGIKSRFYGLPLAYLAWCYLAVQLILGFLLMLVPGIPYRAGIVLNTLFLGIFLIGLAGAGIGRGMVERIDQKIGEKVFYVKSLQADIDNLADRMVDGSLKIRLKALAEAIRYSDPMSSHHLATLEKKIEATAAALIESAADIAAASFLCDELRQLIAERNRKCKLLK
jgi:hypothetical protein